MDDDRLVEDRHHRVHPPLDALEVGEQSGVVEREPDPAGEDLGEAHVLGPVAAPRPGRHQGQRPEIAIARPDRDHDRGAEAERAQELEVVGGVRHPPQFLVANPRPPFRDMAPAPLDLDKPLGQRRRAGSHPLLDRAGVVPPAHPGRDPGDAPVVDRVDHADIGERGHDHLGHPPQRLGERQRPVGDGADRIEQSHALGATGGAPPQPGAEHGEAAPTAITSSRTTCSDSPPPAFQAGLAAAAMIAAAPTSPVAAGRANSAATNGAATKVPTIAADSSVRSEVGADAEGQGNEAGGDPEEARWSSLPGPPGFPLAQSAKPTSHQRSP